MCVVSGNRDVIYNEILSERCRLIKHYILWLHIRHHLGNDWSYREMKLRYDNLH